MVENNDFFSTPCRDLHSVNHAVEHDGDENALLEMFSLEEIRVLSHCVGDECTESTKLGNPQFKKGAGSELVTGKPWS